MMPHPRFNWPAAVRSFFIVIGIGAVIGVVSVMAYLHHQDSLNTNRTAGSGNEGWAIPLTALMGFTGAVAGAAVALVPAIIAGVASGKAFRKTPLV